jgi:hypothetical protein
VTSPFQHLVFPKQDTKKAFREDEGCKEQEAKLNHCTLNVQTLFAVAKSIYKLRRVRSAFPSAWRNPKPTVTIGVKFSYWGEIFIKMPQHSLLSVKIEQKRDFTCGHMPYIN